MSQQMKPYDPKAVFITLGAILVEGYADGTFVKITSDEPAYSLKVGADGESVRTRTNNNAATIELTLMQSSLTNTLLSQLHNIDRNLPGGTGAVPFLCKDALGASLYAAEQCWVEKRPDAEFGLEASTRTWTLRTNNLIPLDGGA